MNRPRSPCAFLLAMTAGIVACGLCVPLFALSAIGIVCCREELFNLARPDLPPGSISTAVSVPVSNTDMHVSFRQPEGWTFIESGNFRNGPWLIPYVTYGLKGRPDAPTLKITYQDSGAIYPQDVIVRGEASAWRLRGADVTDELYKTIDGIPAGGVRYIIGGKVGFYLWVSQPGLTHDFE